MPKIPTYTAEGSAGTINLPARMPYDDNAAAIQAAGQFAAGGQQLGALSGQMARAQKALQDEKDELDAVRLAGLADARLEEVRLTVARAFPDTMVHGEEFAKAAAKIEQETLAQTKSGAVQHALAKHFARKVPMARMGVEADALKIQSATNKVALGQTLTTVGQHAAMASTPESRDEMIATGEALIARAVTRRTLEPDPGETMRKAFRSDIERAEITALLRDDPEEAERRLSGTNYTHISETARESFITRAAVRVKAVRDEAVRADEAREKHFAESLKADKAALVTDFERRAREAATEDDRVALLRDLNLRQDMRQIEHGDYSRIYDAIVKPKTTPSDPDVLSRLGLDAHSAAPKVTEADIDRAHDRYRNGLPGLNYADATKLKDRVRETREGLKNEAKAERMKEHNQAEQELRAVLGIRPGMLAQATGDDPIARLYGQGLIELRTRSNAFTGTESPLAVIQEMRPRFEKAAGGNAAMKATEIRSTLVAPTREALQAQYSSGAISRPLYLLELDKFKRLDGLVTTYSPPPAGSAGASGGGPTPRPRLK